MSLSDDLERCSGCTARFRAGGCDSWGTEIPPCERVYDVNVFEELCGPVGHFKCPFHNVACSSVTAEMWEDVLEEEDDA